MTTAPAGPGRTASGARGFTVASGEAGIRSSAGVVAAAALDGLLLLQEMDGAPARDRRARQHGRALLEALARLQLGLLAEVEDGEALERLAALLEHAPEAADPGLRDVLGAVALRAHVELARRKV